MPLRSRMGHSDPRLIPLPAATVHDVAARVTRHPFARIHGGWWDTVVDGDVALIMRSAQRYARWST